MARKFGVINKMSEKFEDYSYIINGVGGIGKTTLVYEIGKIITGSNEGTFIITCGGENKPKHIPGAFGDVAPDFKTFCAIVKELCDNKAEYPDTRFIAIDSLDEYARLTENFVVAEWNAQCDINERVKSISQAYKGYQKGESRACDLMIQQVIKLQEAGYSILEIGHTKTKMKEDVITKVQFEQLTCNLDNKYYNALKDKVNLVAMCYWENVVENIEEKKNAFTKKMDKVGELTDRKRVMVFADDDNAIDTKTHFEYITHKIDLSAEGFIKAVEEAIAAKIAATEDKPATKKSTSKKTTKKSPVVDEEDDELMEKLKSVVAQAEEDETTVNEMDGVNEDEIADDTAPFDIDEYEEEVVDENTVITLDDDRLNAIRAAFKASDVGVKTEVKKYLTSYGNKLSAEMKICDVNAIEKILGLTRRFNNETGI
jgi:hypothetical protein